MTKNEIFGLMNGVMSFHLATLEDGEPRVRGMLLYKADETGVVFHTGVFKDLYKQLLANPAAQMCFFDPASGTQVRVRGQFEEVADAKLKEEIYNHPSREFLRNMCGNSMESPFYETIRVFRMKNGIANVWTFAANCAAKEDIYL